MSERRSTCPVCGETSNFVATPWHDDPNTWLFAAVCRVCGFCAIDENVWDYGDEGFSENSVSAPRVGQADVPGREFHMCSFGTGLLDRSDLSVLISGSGLSLDWQHVEKLAVVESVAVSDVENFTDAPRFVSLDEQGAQKFDLVVACEVVEHFSDPIGNFEEILSNVADDGIFIASTNVNDGSPLRRHWYPFIPGHLSYWSADSLQRVGERFGFDVDFRVPHVALQWGGPRKRYVIFSRGDDVRRRIVEFFGSSPFAPSEVDNRSFKRIGA